MYVNILTMGYRFTFSWRVPLGPYVTSQCSLLCIDNLVDSVPYRIVPEV